MQAKKKVQQWTRALAWVYALFFGLTLWAAYSDRLPKDLLQKIPYYDKIGHIVLYCIATYLGHCVLQNRHFRRVGVLLPVFPCLFGLFTWVEEGIQGFSPYRTLDASDLVCSTAGIVLGYFLAEWGKGKAKR